MQKILILILIIIMQNNIDAKIRPAAVAGAFYTNNPKALKFEIEGYLKKADKLNDKEEILALVAPHAGYVYSGWVAACAYKQVEGLHYDCVVIISPSHICSFAGSSIYSGDGYETPLGIMRVDKDLASQISSYGVPISDKGHEVDKDGGEHALEVHLPFLQLTLGDVKIVPIIMGSQDVYSIDNLSNALYQAISKSGKKVLIVASSDLSHFHAKRIANSMDALVYKAFARYDYFYLETMLNGRKAEACGGAPILVAMQTAERLGGNKAETLKYATSSDSPYIESDSNRVVGYFSGIIRNKPNLPLVDFPEFSSDEKSMMVDYAKATIKSVAEKTNLPSMSEPSPNMIKEYPVFTTIFKYGNLRGCIGYTISDSSLIDNIRETATLASSKDPRFKPVAPFELESLEVELSVLSRFKKSL